MSTQSKPFSLGERAQPGAPSTGRPRASATSSRLPGSTGMPKCSMRPPIASTAAGITSRRSAIAEAPNTITSSAPAVEHLLDRLGERALLVRHAPLCHDRGARRRDPLGRHLERLVDHLAGQPRQQGRDHADLADAIGRNPDERRRRAHRVKRRIACLPATANGMILTVAIISPATTGL